jgi:hypothetical protein
MYTLLASNPEEFIPFFAIFFTFMLPILAIYFYYKHKSKVMDERRLMIEKGLTPPPLKETFESSSSSKTPLSKGSKHDCYRTRLVGWLFYISTLWYSRAI